MKIIERADWKNFMRQHYIPQKMLVTATGMVHHDEIMRFRTLVLVLGILLLCQSLSLAMPQEEKTKILASEWQRIEYQKKVSQVKEVGSQTFIKKEIEERKPALPETFNKTITLRAKDVALHTILARISEATGCNIVCDPDVNSIVLLSVDTQNLPVWRVLNTILFPLSYGFKVKDKDLVILSKETRTFKLNLPPDTQSFSDTISNESSTIS